MWFWSKKQQKPEHLEILGDYDPGDPRAQELLAIFEGMRKRIHYAESILANLEHTSPADITGNEIAKVEELITACYHELEKIRLDTNSGHAPNEHHVFCNAATLLVPVLLKLEHTESALELFDAMAIETHKKNLADRHWQIRRRRQSNAGN